VACVHARAGVCACARVPMVARSRRARFVVVGLLFPSGRPFGRFAAALRCAGAWSLATLGAPHIDGRTHVRTPYPRTRARTRTHRRTRRHTHAHARTCSWHACTRRLMGRATASLRRRRFCSTRSTLRSADAACLRVRMSVRGCVRVCTRACVSACVRLRASVSALTWALVRVRARACCGASGIC
jgi:hypothetical protein